jgi:hypothetical protein
MNHEQFGRCAGQTLRLEPPAVGPDGAPIDDDWTVANVDPAGGSATLRNLTRGGEVVVGFDHVRGYDTDPARGQGFGFLNMLWQIRIARDGSITGRPIPARPGVAPGPDFHPLIVNDGQANRHLTWASRDHGVALLPDGEPQQLFETFIAVCDALRADTRREPQFDPPNDIRHEIVWELTPDHRSKHKLLGGMGGRHGTSVLVLTHNRAQPRPEPVVDAAPPEVETVDLEFPARSGLQAELETAGFRLRWVREEQAARRREQGWEAVVVERDGRRLTFKVSPAMPAVDPAALVLMKHRA